MSIQEVYTFGCGDRFGRQGKAQSAAYIEVKKLGIEVIPVWNKSNREHKETVFRNVTHNLLNRHILPVFG